MTSITIDQVDFSKLSLNSLCEVYAASFGICTGWTEAGKNNLRKSLEYQRGIGKLRMPTAPSQRLLNELK